MRKRCSILIALVLGFLLGSGPSLNAIPAGALSSAQSGWSGNVDESRLPACCRRNGLHHCTMHSGETTNTAGATAQRQLDSHNHDSFAKLTAPNSCPCAPPTLVSIAPHSAAIQSSSLDSFEPSRERLLASTKEHIPASSKQRTWPPRGPPASPAV